MTSERKPVTPDTENQSGIVIRNSQGKLQKGSAPLWRNGATRKISRDELAVLRSHGPHAINKLIAMMEAEYPVVVDRGEVRMFPHVELQFKAAMAIIKRVYGGDDPRPLIEAPQRARVDLSKMTDEELGAIETLRKAQKRMQDEAAAEPPADGNAEDEGENNDG